MHIQQILELMEHTPWNWYYVADWKYLTPNITPEEYRKSFKLYADRQLKLDEIGSSICSVLMPWWWIGIEQYDFTQFDEFMEALLKGHPDRWFVPRIKLEPPLDWQRAHPEELCVYWNGPATGEEIRNLVGTPLHDTAGHGGMKEPPQLISNQSFSSKVWLADASKALSVLVNHVESSPYGHQVIGYMLAFGNCGECMWWGDWRSQGDPRKGDFGISHKKHFFNWALEKYGSLDKLRKAWNLPELTLENIPMPTPPERWSINGKDLRGVLLAEDQRQVDCNEFHSKVCFDAIETFGKVVKDICGKATGSFYGYFQDETVGYAGHLAIQRALTTPYVDFYSSPKGYHYCLAGDPGASQAPAQSFARKKLWIEENDCRSHHAADLNRKSANADETKTVFWREIYRALTLGFGFWWMDIGGLKDDWYSDDEMVAMFKQQAAFYKKWSPIPRKSTAQVLFVEDEASCSHITYLSGPNWSLRLRLERELRLCGTAVDHLRVADLLEMDLSQYKFIVFCHAYVMPKDLWQQLRQRIRPDAHVLWNYAAGLLDPAFNPDNQKAVTGFRTAECPGRMHHPELYRHIYWHSAKAIPQDYPLLEILPEDGQEILQTSPEGHILTARKNREQGKSIYSADLTLRTPLLRQLLADANVSFSAPMHCAVLEDEMLVGFFPRYDVCFTYRFAGVWRNVITSEIVSGDVQLQIREKRFAIFEKVNI